MQTSRDLPSVISGRFANLADYYFMLRKRLWLILSVLFVTVLFTALYTFSMKPVYSATARIVIGKETKRSPLTGQYLDYESFTTKKLTYQTHFKMVIASPAAIAEITKKTGRRGVYQRPWSLSGAIT